MPAEPSLRFFAAGTPCQAKYLSRASGRRRVRHPDHTAWVITVRRAALDALGLTFPPKTTLFGTAPVMLGIRFWLPRPIDHLGTGRNAGKLRPSAALAPTGKPDLENLIKPVQDALSDFAGKGAIAWRDDSQVVVYEPAAAKLYVDPGQPVGVLVHARVLTDLPAPW